MKVYLTINPSIFSNWANHDFILELAQYLENNFNAEVIYGKDKPLFIEKFNYTMPDCEIIIYDEVNDILKAYSFAESRTDLFDKVFIGRNNEKDILISVHYDTNWGLDVFPIKDYKFKLKRFFFQPYSPLINYGFFYRRRKLIEENEFIDKMFFRCTTGRGDEEELYKLDIINDKFRPLPIDVYLHKAMYYKVGLAISCQTGICHRDLDYMGIGLPMIRTKYYGQYEPPLIPNYHYIAVESDNIILDPTLEIRGGKEYVEAYTNKFMEVKNNKPLLDFISKNARKYFEDNCSTNNRLKLILEKLEIF